MKNFKTIVLAVELVSDSDAPVIKKALQMATLFHSKIILIHAVEHQSYVYGTIPVIDVDKELIASAKVMMAKLEKKIAKDIPCKSIVSLGSAKHVIVDEAKNNKADLIILGSHGRHGVRLLLGSTANAVLHAAHCDVLAVRI